MADSRQEQFLNLPFQEKLEFLYGLPARQKLDLILSAPEAERLVRSFAPETLFYTLKEIGSADAGDLLSLAVPEQIKWLFDLDCWDKDRPNLARMREWIEPLAEAGRKRMAEALMELDIELVSLLLRQYIKVHRIDEPQEFSDMPSDRFVQFDEHYLIEFIRNDAIQAHLLEFIEEAFERDYNYFAALMEEIYWGVVAELEEQAYQFRSSRMADRGFPDFFESQSVFAYLSPRNFAELRAQYPPPVRDALEDAEFLPPEVSPVPQGADNSLFNAALTAGFAAQGKRQLRSEMALVANRVLVAQAVDFGDLEAVRIAVEMTHDYLNLALEHLASGELRSAIDHLRETHLFLLFRLGVSLTIDLRKRAELVLAKFGLAPGQAREILYLDSPYREALSGFLRRQPLFHGGLDGDGAVVMRAFRTMADLHLGYAMLERLDAVPELFIRLLGLDIAAASFRAHIAGYQIQLSQILVTALVRHALEGRLSMEPIEPRILGRMYALLMTRNGPPAHLNEEFHRRTSEVLEAQLGSALRKRCADFVDSCLNVLEEDFAEIEPAKSIDQRFLRSLLIRREHEL
ncbi:MAG: DUF6178 family protein [Candidatus Binataceae bacterium]